MCGGGEESWELVWEECMYCENKRSWQEMVNEVLAGEGMGEK